MTEEDFRKLCNTYGFAPSRALRELIDCVRAQEIEACAKVTETYEVAGNKLGAPDFVMVFKDCAAAIRARKDKT